ncbi:hypothetical protein Nepgr_032234 [Nepenthes gracilis]|uniref:Uncharacterized protein n=1 Tax=Nepenthes gracilis TaxID=150966 RepID=A0AAD3Y846_NEPGR|nr:hypothetical protein Nepgr_032234 [Nepenthes gracilis]
MPAIASPQGSQSFTPLQKDVLLPSSTPNASFLERLKHLDGSLYDPSTGHVDQWRSTSRNGPVEVMEPKPLTVATVTAHIVVPALTRSMHEEIQAIPTSASFVDSASSHFQSDEAQSFPKSSWADVVQSKAPGEALVCHEPPTPMDPPIVDQKPHNGISWCADEQTLCKASAADAVSFEQMENLLTDAKVGECHMAPLIKLWRGSCLSCQKPYFKLPRGEDHDVDVPTFDDVEPKRAIIEAWIADMEGSPNFVSRIVSEVECLRRQLVEIKAQCCLAFSPLQLLCCSQEAHGYVPDEASAGSEAAPQEVRFQSAAEPPCCPQGPFVGWVDDMLSATSAPVEEVMADEAISLDPMLHALRLLLEAKALQTYLDSFTPEQRHIVEVFMTSLSILGSPDASKCSQRLLVNDVYSIHSHFEQEGTWNQAKSRRQQKSASNNHKGSSSKSDSPKAA